MITWVNCERDACITGSGAMHIEGYSFLHQVYGQIPAVAKTLRPTGIASALGYAKRFGIGFFGHVNGEPNQPCSDSKMLLLEFHDWLGMHASSLAVKPYLDPYALTLFHAVQRAATDFATRAQDINDLTF